MATKICRPHRMWMKSAQTNAVDGTVVWSPVKSLWFSGMAITALVFGPLTFSWDAAAISCLLTCATLCFGHSVGLHRLLIHRSFQCPLWLEYCMVYAGVLVGMGGPRRMVLLHENRDWSQRQAACHPFFIHRSGILQDAFWNLHCEFRFAHPPEFCPEPAVTGRRFYRLLDRFWMAAQLPLAAILYVLGGWSWVVWGIAVRVTISLVGHWLVGYLAHNCGQRDWHVEGASVQGYNVAGLGMLTMGEAWHNNHHAFPESARLGLKRGQHDPGWWLLCVLKAVGLVWDVVLPADLPERPELKPVTRRSRQNVFHHVPGHVGQTEIAPLKTVR